MGMTTWHITYHAAETEIALSHRRMTDLLVVRKELERFAEIAKPRRNRPNGRVEMVAEGYCGKLIAIPAQRKIVTVTPLD